MLKMFPIILLKMNLETKNFSFIKIFASFEQSKMPIKKSPYFTGHNMF